MRNTLKSFLFGVSLISVSLLSSCRGNEAVYDTVLFGNVITLDDNGTVAEAVGVKKGKIVYIGDRQGIENTISASTKVYDYKDNYIYPGFIDPHCHLASPASAFAGGLMVDTSYTKDQVLNEFKEYIREDIKQNKGKVRDFYKCYGSYALSKLNPDKHFTQFDLNQICIDLAKECLPIDVTQHTLFVGDYGGHNGCFSSAGLQKAFKHLGYNITWDPNTETELAFCKRISGYCDELIKNKCHDIIEIDTFNEGDFKGLKYFTGNVSEQVLFQYFFSTDIDVEELKETILMFQKNALQSTGYTTITDCFVTQEHMPMVQALSELGAEGKLKFKIKVYYAVQEFSEHPLLDVNTALELAKKYNNDYFQLVGVKLFVDGVPEKLTCYTTEDYVDLPEGLADLNPYRGDFRWDPKWRPEVSRSVSFSDIVAYANMKGLACNCHTYGDAAVKYALDQYEIARKTYPYATRNCISHIGYITDEDISRIAENHIIPMVPPHWAIRTAGADVTEKSIFGEYDPSNPNKRSHMKMYKIKSLFGNNNENHICFHTDGMCPYGVPFMIYSGINRVDPSNADPNVEGYLGPRDKNECINNEEALLCLTKNPAYALMEEDNMGSIEIGKCADFSIYGVDFRNPLLMRQENYQVAFTPCIATFVNGNLSYHPE